MVLVVAMTGMGAEAFDEDARVAAHAPPAPMATNTMTTATIVRCLLKAGALRWDRVPFVSEAGCLATSRVLSLADNLLKRDCAMGSQARGPAHRGPWGGCLPTPAMTCDAALVGDASD